MANHPSVSDLGTISVMRAVGTLPHSRFPFNSIQKRTGYFIHGFSEMVFDTSLSSDTTPELIDWLSGPGCLSALLNGFTGLFIDWLDLASRLGKTSGKLLPQHHCAAGGFFGFCWWGYSEKTRLGGNTIRMALMPWCGYLGPSPREGREVFINSNIWSPIQTWTFTPNSKFWRGKSKSPTSTFLSNLNHVTLRVREIWRI